VEYGASPGVFGLQDELFHKWAACLTRDEGRPAWGWLSWRAFTPSTRARVLPTRPRPETETARVYLTSGWEPVQEPSQAWSIFESLLAFTPEVGSYVTARLQLLPRLEPELFLRPRGCRLSSNLNFVLAYFEQPVAHSTFPQAST